jgi:hypothetical protein
VPEIAAAILLQVHRRSEGFSNASGRPYKSNARENVQSTRSVAKAIRDPIWPYGVSTANEAHYIVHEVGKKLRAPGRVGKSPTR